LKRFLPNIALIQAESTISCENSLELQVDFGAVQCSAVQQSGSVFRVECSAHLVILSV
jgi:hypothetical protein